MCQSGQRRVPGDEILQDFDGQGSSSMMMHQILDMAGQVDV